MRRECDNHIQVDGSGTNSEACRDQNQSSAAAEIVRQFAHDLRQPLAAVITLASAAFADLQAPEPVLQRLRLIAGEAAWMAKMVDDLLAGAGDESGIEPVEISALVRDVVASELLTYRGRITVRQVDTDEPRYVMAVNTRLRRALANVLANATRAAGSDGQVEVTERAETCAIVIEVADNGPGFGQVERVHGIGLEIAVQMLEECGGRMDIEPRGYGQTLVRMSLPVVSGGLRDDGP